MQHTVSQQYTQYEILLMGQITEFWLIQIAYHFHAEAITKIYIYNIVRYVVYQKINAVLFELSDDLFFVLNAGCM